MLREYSDVLTLVEDEYVPAIDNFVYGSLCNRNRIYRAGGYTYRVFDSEYLIRTETENEEALMKISALDGLDENIFSVLQYQQNEQSLTGCGSSTKKQAVYFDNEGRCTDDRKVFITLQATPLDKGPDEPCRIVVSSKVEGKIRDFWCDWSSYKTRLKTRNSFYTLRAKGVITSVFVDAFSDYSGEVKWHVEKKEYVMPWDKTKLPVLTFDNVHAEASSRGVGFDHWAVIDCK